LWQNKYKNFQTAETENSTPCIEEQPLRGVATRASNDGLILQTMAEH